MKIFQSGSFERKVKKFTKKEKEILDNNIRVIMKTPRIGDEKRGDLKGVVVYKFKMESTQYLLSYRFEKKDLELIMIGPHENYYKDLKTYLKTRQ